MSNEPKNDRIITPAIALKPGRRRTKRRTTPGSAPGTLVVDPEAPPPRMRVIAFGPEAMEEKELTDAEDVRAYLSGFPVTWLNVDGLGDARVLQQLGDIFGIHRLALEDVINVHQRAKVEEYSDQLFMVTQSVEAGARLETEQISVFVGRNYVVTFQERAGDCFEPIRDRLRTERGRIRQAGAGYLAYAIIDAVVDHYFPVLENYGERLEELEGQVVARADRSDLQRINELKRDLLTLRRAIWPLREAVHTVLRDPNPLFTDETRLYFRDTYDHTVRIIDIVETYRELVGGLMDIYLSTVSNRLNEVMKVLTIIATIFMPLSFLAGLYGMNFNTAKPLNMPELNWDYGYFYCLGLMATVAGAFLIYFRRKGWF